MKKNALAAVLIAVALLRVASTFTVFSATADEPMHISAGLQLLSRHHYTLQLENPPLPRAIMSFGPWVGGMEFDPKLPLAEQLSRVFYTGGSYERNLILARSANLLFLALAAVATWLWARRLLDETGALVAKFLFTFEPVVLGYSGLATHDCVALAGTALALLAFARWLDERTTRNAALAGAAYGLSVGFKFSCLAYVPAACLAMFLVRRPSGVRWKHVVVAAIVGIATLAATYGFQLRTFFFGMKALIELNRQGFPSYFGGRFTDHGWWWYFPATIGLKATLATLALTALAWVAWRERAVREPLAAAVAILAVAMASTLDLGIRYVLPLFAPLAIATAAVAMRLPRAVALALLVWHGVASIAAHPDYFPYFNLLAGRDPSRYVIDSNVDWGQDVLRLGEVVREERIPRLGVMVMGLNRIEEHGITNAYMPDPSTPVNGWVAVSDHAYRMHRVNGGWWWLAQQPYRRNGKSIRLYNLP